MAQLQQQETQDVDPITSQFIVDRQNFWQRFTGATVYAAGAIVVLLILMWWFIV